MLKWTKVVREKHANDTSETADRPTSSGDSHHQPEYDSSSEQILTQVNNSPPFFETLRINVISDHVKNNYHQQGGGNEQKDYNSGKLTLLGYCGYSPGSRARLPPGSYNSVDTRVTCENDSCPEHILPTYGRSSCVRLNLSYRVADSPKEIIKSCVSQDSSFDPNILTTSNEHLLQTTVSKDSEKRKSQQTDSRKTFDEKGVRLQHIKSSEPSKPELYKSSAITSIPKVHQNWTSKLVFTQVKMASALPDLTAPLTSQVNEILGPEVQWDETHITLAQVAEKDSLPCICCYEEESRENQGKCEFLCSGLKVYSRQPVLFHERAKKKQAHARTIHKDKRGVYFELGQTILIPDDYQGWFELVPSDFSRATCFKSIEEVAKVMPAKFFTRSNLRGIRVEGEEDDQKFLERKVHAGSVLETKGTFTAKWKTRAETGTFKRKTTEWEMQEVTYLKCVHTDQAELLVPLTHKGKFNAIYSRGQLTQNAVFSMKDILTDLSLPIKIRLLYGKAPVVPCIFTGMMVVRDACMDDSLVGSTLLNSRNVLFQIPISSPVKVKYLANDESFQEMSTYKDAKKLCRKYAHLYSTMIKLSPDLDTGQRVIQHVPSDPSVMREAEEALRALDLITDISLTDEPRDHLLDTDSASGESNSSLLPKDGTLAELTEYKSRESHTHV